MKMVEEALAFVQDNKIETLPELRQKVNEIRNRLAHIRRSGGSLVEFDMQANQVVIAQRVEQTVKTIAAHAARNIDSPQRRQGDSRNGDLER